MPKIKDYLENSREPINLKFAEFSDVNILGIVSRQVVNYPGGPSKSLWYHLENGLIALLYDDGIKKSLHVIL